MLTGKTTARLPPSWLCISSFCLFCLSSPTTSILFFLLIPLLYFYPYLLPFSSLILAVFPLSFPATLSGRAVQKFLRCFKLLYKTAAHPDSAFCTISSVSVFTCATAVIAFIVSCRVRHSCVGLKMPTYAHGFTGKRCMHVIQYSCLYFYPIHSHIMLIY